MAPGANSSTIVGLLGGGQLGRMLCEAANPLGMEIAVLDTKDCPAKQVHQSKHHVTGSFKDPLAIRELAAHSDYLTVEIEHVDTHVLEEVATEGVEITLADGSTIMHRPPIHPSYETLRLIQDKFLQKEHFSNSGLPVAKQVSIPEGSDSILSLKTVLSTFGFPFMLKARKGSYDGRGNYKVASEEDFGPALEALKGATLYAEKWVPFKMELAVMVVRTEDDEGNLRRCIAYPAVETIHEDSICTKVYMPPRGVSQATCEKARELATAVISTLSGRGVYAVEMFVLQDGSLMVNEVAPRPHNSGHYTIEAVPQMSQYQAQLHAVLDLDMPEKLVPKVKSALMLNILGGALPTSHHKVVRLARSTFGTDTAVYLHLYGKESKPGRKIGHITITGDGSIEELQQAAKPFIEMVDEIRQERLDVANGIAEPKPDDKPPTVAKPSKKQKQKQGTELNQASAQAGESKSNKKQDEEPAKSDKPTPVARAQSAAQVNGGTSSSKPLVLVTMGSDSDLPVLKAGLDILKKFNVSYALDITSAHRTPKYMMKVADEAAGKGIKVIIAAAGGAAHLPGMLSSETPLPVIGVPVKATHMDGLDSLLSIVQMPRGVPTATVGINNSTNAALLAIRILGSFMPGYHEKMKDYQRDMEEAVIEKGTKLREGGDVKYLASM
ncbi:Phosphoribosylaminoimidazole carboxylase [Podospora aff. communis PSN243]|uniref:Phosphoribosylaminoimidazole carboxylase n=1 Tax=Podospora aff. communis PSN243 TaxID=3040156 RepID=A0AAV9GLE8_9PEZI|nr:Phosphoribosylaminoimidazole carboxylase [Podospora aff. communis PSN243]